MLSAGSRSHPPNVANEHDYSRSQETEPVSILDSQIALRASSLITNPSLYLDRAAIHLNLHPYYSFRLTYRNHTSGRSKSGVYAQLVCRKCGERITEERQLHLDTSATPVCHLFTEDAHLPVGVDI